MSTAVDGWRPPHTDADAPSPIAPDAPADGTAGVADDTADAGAEAVDDAIGATGPAVDDPAEELVRIRGEIEAVDRRIVGLIAERVALARRVGPLKQALGVPILDPPREAAIVRRAGALAREAGLSDEDVRYVFWHLVGLSRRVQLEEG